MDGYAILLQPEGRAPRMERARRGQVHIWPHPDDPDLRHRLRCYALDPLTRWNAEMVRVRTAHKEAA